MMKTVTAVAALAMLALAMHANIAAAANGVTPIDVPPQSDTIVSLPVVKNVVGDYEVTAKSGNTITLGSAGFSVGQFPQNTQGDALFYVRFVDGTLAGRWFNIDAQGAGPDTLVLSVEDTGASASTALGSAAVGDTVQVIEHWTIATALPDGFRTVSYEAAAGFNQPFEIRLLDNNSVNINKAPGSAIIHTNGEWKQGAANVDDVVIAPQQGILLRNKLPASSGSPDNPKTLRDESSNTLTFYAFGLVQENPVVELIPVEASQNDVYVTAFNLFPTTLGDINLGGSPAFITTAGFTVGDEVRLFDNAAIGFNKAPSAPFRFDGTDWKDPGANVANNQPLTPGECFLIRKTDGTVDQKAWPVQ